MNTENSGDNKDLGILYKIGKSFENFFKNFFAMLRIVVNDNSGALLKDQKAQFKNTIGRNPPWYIFDTELLREKKEKIIIERRNVNSHLNVKDDKNKIKNDDLDCSLSSSIQSKYSFSSYNQSSLLKEQLAADKTCNTEHGNNKSPVAYAAANFIRVLDKPEEYTEEQSQQAKKTFNKNTMERLGLSSATQNVAQVISETQHEVVSIIESGNRNNKFQNMVNIYGCNRCTQQVHS